MGTPEYALKKEVQYSTGPHSDPIVFAPGTLVFVFWNDAWLPAARREELAKARGEVTKPHQGHWMYTPPPVNKDLVMCIIGTTWLTIDRNWIRKL